MTTKAPPTRLYLACNDGTYRPFMWFLEYRPSEMMFGLYGLSSKTPRLSFQYRDRDVSVEEARAVRFNFDDKVPLDKPLEHLTVHVSGEFHIKLKDTTEPRVHKLWGSRHLDAATPQFLDFKVFTDLPQNYRAAIALKNPYVAIPCPENAVLAIDARFSGTKHDLEGSLLEEVRRTTGRSEYAAIRLNGAYLKGMLRPKMIPVDTAVLATRPPGAIVALFFPTAHHRYLVKAFHVC